MSLRIQRYVFRFLNFSSVQFNTDYQHYFPDYIDLITEFPKWTPGILAAARLSRKTSYLRAASEQL